MALRLYRSFLHFQNNLRNVIRGAMTLECKYQPQLLPEFKNYAEYFLQRARAHGNNIALISGLTGQNISYTQLNIYSVQLASALHKHGVQKDDVMCVVMPNCVEYVITLLAVPSIGAVLTFANPSSTIKDIKQQMRHSNSSYLLISSNLLHLLDDGLYDRNSIKSIIVVGETKKRSESIPFWDLVTKGDGFIPHVDFNIHQQVALLPYSSGTTGLPKGVMLSHYNVLASLFLFGKNSSMPYLSEGETQLMVFPMFHSGGILFSLQGIIHGSTTVMMPVFEFETFLSMVEKYKATYLGLPPPLTLRLAKDPVVPKYDLSNLKTIIFGAAPSSLDTLTEMKNRLHIQNLIQVYGMTENMVLSHMTPTDDMKLGSTGTVQAGTQCKVVDVSTGRVLGPHENGEILVKSPGNMIGYLNNPTATAETIDKDGWLHTGDIGHYDDEGHFYIVDRLKELIKYKGFQVAPAELETVILTHPSVADTAVVGVPDERAGEVPRAYVVLKQGHTVSQKEVIDFVKDNVSPHKQLRGGVIFTDQIPKTQSGKILRKILREKSRKQTNVNSKL